jgi:hypothetical protein
MGWGQSPSFPYQEGSFYGNIFISPPKAYYCNGKDFDQGVVPGRLGAGQNDAPYTNPLGYAGALCKNYCTSANYAGDGFSSCPGLNGERFKHVVTVWRNFDAATSYKICNRTSGKCLDAAMSGTTTQVVQRGYSGSGTQMWSISQVSPGKYKFMHISSGLSLDLTGGRTTNGTALTLSPYAGTATQLWGIGSMADGTGYNKLAPAASASATITVPTSALYNDGVVLDVSQYLWGDFQKWTIAVAN